MIFPLFGYILIFIHDHKCNVYLTLRLILNKLKRIFKILFSVSETHVLLKWRFSPILSSVTFCLLVFVTHTEDFPNPFCYNSSHPWFIDQAFVSASLLFIMNICFYPSHFFLFHFIILIVKFMDSFHYSFLSFVFFYFIPFIFHLFLHSSYFEYFSFLFSFHPSLHPSN